MFSANENLALRQHKRRITTLIESTIPEAALDAGVVVMVMQVSCRAPGCVPLETAIAIVFPRGQRSELIPGLPESGSGGTFKTKVLLPMADVTRDDVLDALPPEFEGGRRTMEKLCLRARDVMLAQITQIMNEEDVEGKRLMAEYLMGCLKDYVDADCKAPEVGEPFPPKTDEGGKSNEGKSGNKETESIGKNGNEVPASDYKGLTKETSGEEEVTKRPDSADAVKRGVSNTGNSIEKKKIPVVGNFVVRRKKDGSGKKQTGAGSSSKTEVAKWTVASSGAALLRSQQASGETAMDWRRRQNMEKQLSALTSPRNLIQRMSDREHAPGVRRAGCPCCDPDNPSNVVDNMMML